MTSNDVAVLMDMAAQTVVPMGLEVTVKVVDGRLALAYGNTLTFDSERAFLDFQTYARQAEEEAQREEAEFEQAGLEAAERAWERAGGYREPEEGL